MAQKRVPEIYSELRIAYNPYRIEVYTTDIHTDAFQELAEISIYSEIREFLVLVKARFTIRQLERWADIFLDAAGHLSFSLDVDGEITNCIVVWAEDEVQAQRMRQIIDQEGLPPQAFVILDDDDPFVSDED